MNKYQNIHIYIRVAASCWGGIGSLVVYILKNIRNDFSFDHLSSTANPREAMRGHEGPRGAKGGLEGPREAT